MSAVSSSEEEESGDEEGNQETRPSETYNEGDYEDEDLNAGTQRVMRGTSWSVPSLLSSCLTGLTHQVRIQSSKSSKF